MAFSHFTRAVRQTGNVRRQLSPWPPLNSRPGFVFNFICSMMNDGRYHCLTITSLGDFWSYYFAWCFELFSHWSNLLVHRTSSKEETGCPTHFLLVTDDRTSVKFQPWERWQKTERKEGRNYVQKFVVRTKEWQQVVLSCCCIFLTTKIKKRQDTTFCFFSLLFRPFTFNSLNVLFQK